MSKTIGEVIVELQEQIQALDAQTTTLKRKVNDLCPYDGLPEIYPDVSVDDVSTIKTRTVRLRPDEFTADKLMKAIRRYLVMRKEANPDNAPAKVEDICAALRDGGYDFRGKDSLSAVSISLGKSSHTFKRLTNGMFGLNSWYGITRPRIANKAETPQGDDLEEEDETNGQVAVEDVVDDGPAKVEMNPE